MTGVSSFINIIVTIIKEMSNHIKKSILNLIFLYLIESIVARLLVL